MPAARSKKENSSATPPSDDAHLKVSQSENSKSKRKYVPNARSFSGLSLHNPFLIPRYRFPFRHLMTPLQEIDN